MDSDLESVALFTLAARGLLKAPLKNMVQGLQQAPAV